MKRLKELLGSSGCDIGVFPLNRYTHTGVDIRSFGICLLKSESVEKF